MAGCIINYEKIIPDAYHGTSREIAECILQEGFKPSRGDKQFSGDGVYFFENSPEHAEDWARRGNKPDSIAVFQARINLGKCLDLATSMNHRGLIKKVREKIAARGKAVSDAVAINYFATEIEPDIDTVRTCYTNPLYGRIFPESRYYDYSQIIICVRQTEKILDFEIVFQR